MKTRIRSFGMKAKPLTIVLFFLIFTQASFASRHKHPSAQSPAPVEAIATTAASTSDDIGHPWFAVFISVVIIAVLLWQREIKATNHSAALQAFRDKIVKLEEDASRLRYRNEDTQKEISSIRKFTDQRLNELSDAMKQIKALELRLKLILAANPNAEILAKEKAKKDGEIEAAKTRAREKVALQKQGGAQVQAFLSEIKRG